MLSWQLVVYRSSVTLFLASPIKYLTSFVKLVLLMQINSCDSGTPICMSSRCVSGPNGGKQIGFGEAGVA